MPTTVSVNQVPSPQYYPPNVVPNVPPYQMPYPGVGYTPTPVNHPVNQTTLPPSVSQQSYSGVSFPSFPTPQTPTPPPPSQIYMHRCEWTTRSCNGWAPGKNREMGEHLRESHDFIGNEKDTVHCQWGNCNKSLQRMNMGRHIVSTHLRETTTCPRCNKTLSRPDVASRHEKQCGK
ncbi:hypothetical protein ID866_1071 [Astraeus odoratus]|nr:hypothetical protein ID866_1071 [Astraeus odoratus]